MSYRGKKYREQEDYLHKYSLLDIDEDRIAVQLTHGMKREMKPHAHYPRHDVTRTVTPKAKAATVSAPVSILPPPPRPPQINFMGGVSYPLHPVDTLKMISASSVFGEPQYYRDGDRAQAKVVDGYFGLDRVFARYSLSALDHFQGMTTSQVMEKAIDEALSADFEATLRWAVELRDRYMMRLNPQVILVRAAQHPGRAAFTQAHPGEFAKIAMQVMFRADDVIHQAEYYLAKHGSKKRIPAVLKRAWAQRVGGMDAYAMAKYGNSGMGLIDVVRICHAKGPLVDTLMREGKVPMPEGENTWERLRASGKS